jgi:signal transduction histidine kinase
LHQSEELRQINDKLIELSNFKEGMMQMIIHDLKNPLNILQNIRLFATDRQIEKVETISYSMLNLIQDILDVYKYEKSRINLNFESVPVLNLIETSLKEINTLAQNTNIQIVNNLDEKISVKCDINVINRVLINLLTNAIKYSTPKTEIIVEINQKNENQEEIEFTITNQCEEISKENLDKIFDKFWQFGKSTKKYSSGLGLAFCKLAIENHEKTIIVKSDNSKIQFIFCLNKSENIENVRIKTTDNKKIELNLSDKEKNVLKPYLIELLEIPLYNISAINSVIKKIKKEFDSDAVSLFCSELLEQSLKGNQEIFIKTIKNLLIKT